MIGHKSQDDGDLTNGGKETVGASLGGAPGRFFECQGTPGIDSRDDRRKSVGGRCRRAVGDQRSDVLQTAQSRVASQPRRSGAQADGTACAEVERGTVATGGTHGARHGITARTGRANRAVGVGTDDAAGVAAAGELLKKNETLAASPAEAAGPAETEVTPLLEKCPVSRTEQHAASQQPRREREHRSREAAARFVTAHQASCRLAADCLKVSPRTLSYWCRRNAEGTLTAKLRGRPCREPSLEERTEVALVLEETGPRLGLPTLQTYYPQTPPCVLTYLLKEYRRQFQKDHQQMVETLHWQCPGTVWAIDHSEPPRPMDGHYNRILAVRDLASGAQLAWTPVLDATAAEALPVLEALVRQYGAPLVLKSDNGSAFISKDFGQWLAGWQIVPLFSPVRMPRFNGACEAGIGAAKRRTEYLATRHNRPLDWSANDLYAAQLWANEDNYPDGFAAGTPASRFAARVPIDPIERDTFRAAVLQYEQKLHAAACTQGDKLTDMLVAVHHRRAVRHVLVEHGYLDITRRSIPQPLHHAKCAKIK
jgi:transposase InsO family protein